MAIDLMPNVQPVKDKQTVTADGDTIAREIDGVTMRRMRCIEDDRGEVVEIFRPAWGFHPDPLVYVYQASVRPKAIKGWIVHEKQDDRIFISRGTLRWALYDNRPESPTYELLNVFVSSERNRLLFVIPRGVYHAVQNIGQDEAVFVNMPTRAYDHADPDKFRLPVKNDLIPFDFTDTPGL